MSPLAIVLLVIAGLILLLALGGYVANARRRAAERAALRAQAQVADQHLAQAHAEDKGWERTGLEAAARRVYAERHGAQPHELMLVQVVDRPGIAEDEAVFDADGERVVLGRSGDTWVALSGA
jgi:Tfp pilus assembly protein PilE